MLTDKHKKKIIKLNYKKTVTIFFEKKNIFI